MLVLDALKNHFCGFLIVDVGSQVPVVLQVKPCLLILNHAECIRLFDNGFRAVDIRKALIEQIFPHGFPRQLRTELKPLDNAIPHRIKRHSLVIVQSFPQPNYSVREVFIFFVKSVHQLYTVLFDICQKRGVHAVRDVHDIEF